MKISELAMRFFFGIAAKIVYGTSKQSDWLYEKIHRPVSIYILARNLLNYHLNRPEIFGVISMVVEPSFACNLSCKYCPRSIHKERLQSRPLFMDWDLFCKAVDQAPRSVETITLGALGEPLLHPKIVDMIHYIADCGMRPILYSNCTLLNGTVCDQLAAAPLSVLNVSIEPDGPTSQEYRGVELATIRRNVEIFHAKKRASTDVKLSVVVHPGNVDVLDHIAEEWNGIIKHVKYHSCVDPYFSLSGHARGCLEAVRGNINILTSGEVTPCCIDIFADITIGNIRDEPLEAIIHGERYRHLLTRMLSGTPPDRCLRCSEYSSQGIPVKIVKKT